MALLVLLVALLLLCNETLCSANPLKTQLSKFSQNSSQSGSAQYVH